MDLLEHPHRVIGASVMLDDIVCRDDRSSQSWIDSVTEGVCITSTLLGCIADHRVLLSSAFASILWSIEDMTTGFSKS